VTGLSQGYAFLTFTSQKSAKDAYRDANKSILDSHTILVDFERSRVMKDWVPRRLGGGFGGKKESGQLRFGARDRPFREPPATSRLHISHEQKRSDCWIHSVSKEPRARSSSVARQRYRSPRRELEDRRSSRPGEEKRPRHRYRSRSPTTDHHWRRSRSPSVDRHRRSSSGNRHRSSRHHHQDSSSQRLTRQR
jgi:U11/U12 small nuclear ribonucleoprotein SNRNP35